MNAEPQTEGFECHSADAAAFLSPAPRPAWAGATAEEWADWRWQMRHALRSPDDLRRCFPEWTPGEADRHAAERFRMMVTPYYASLIRAPKETDPIFRLCVARGIELADRLFREPDPFGEEIHQPVPGVIRRYRDRALVLATLRCATYCRHCFRKHSVGRKDVAPAPADPEQAANWLREHPEIREVLISGGDPLTLSTERLDRLIGALRFGAPHIEIIRIGTRIPVVLPQRVDHDLCAMLRRYHPVWMSLHFNHPAELTPASAEACARLADAGIPLNNQTVLLRGVNDDADTLETLFRGLIRMRVRPYYLFQCDPVQGVGHFRVPVRRGRALMRELRRRLSGIAVPTYVRDVPDAESKMPIS